MDSRDAKYSFPDFPHSVIALAAGVQGVDVSELEILTEDDLKVIGETDQKIGGSIKEKIFFHFPLGASVKTLQMPETVLEPLYREIPELRRSASSDWIFSAKLMAHLAEKGRAVVVMTNAGTRNSVNAGVREYFIKNGWIEAVIALPSGLFPQTHVAVDMLVLSRGNRTVRMVDAGEIYDKGRRQSELSPENIEEILGLLAKDSEHSRSVTPKELQEKEYILNPLRYLETVPIPENGVLLGSVASVIRGAQLGAKELDQLATEEDTGIRYLTLSDIQNGMIAENLKYIKEPDRRYHKFYIGDENILISKSGLPLRVALAEITEGEKILATGNLFIVKPDGQRLNPYYLKAYLDSEEGSTQLKSIVAGAILPNLSAESLKNLVIPMAPMAKQAEIAMRYRTKLAEIKDLQARLQHAQSDLKDIYGEG